MPKYDPFLYHFFAIGNDLLFCVAKSRYRNGPGSHVPSETSRRRPQTWQERTPRSVDNTPSKFSHDPCPARRGLVAAIKRCVRKSGFSCCPGRSWNRNKEARQHHKSDFLFFFFFCFPIPHFFFFSIISHEAFPLEKRIFRHTKP